MTINTKHIVILSIKGRICRHIALCLILFNILIFTWIKYFFYYVSALGDEHLLLVIIGNWADLRQTDYIFFWFLQDVFSNKFPDTCNTMYLSRIDCNHRNQSISSSYWSPSAKHIVPGVFHVLFILFDVREISCAPEHWWKILINEKSLAAPTWYRLWTLPNPLLILLFLLQSEKNYFPFHIIKPWN